MKKRTVITTEKREVWVIRQAGGVSAEETRKLQESQGIVESLSAMPEPDLDEDEPNTNEND
ncbi:MAG TPA: hypothetical protein VGO56_13310 [Pyrinomonadaceae bacterium]|nr:hypothetical protein [Pyrinomonadaceae bacterium]